MTLNILSLKDALTLHGLLGDNTNPSGTDLDLLLFKAVVPLETRAAPDPLQAIILGVPSPGRFTTEVDAAVAIAHAIVGSDLPEVLVGAGKHMLSAGSADPSSVARSIVLAALALYIESYS